MNKSKSIERLCERPAGDFAEFIKRQQRTDSCRTCKGTGYIYRHYIIHSLGVKPCPDCNNEKVAP